MSAPALVYFTDENTLGLGKLLRRSGRSDVLYPGHDGLPEVPTGTLDLDWMAVIARLDLVVVTRDRRIRTRPAELRAYWEFEAPAGDCQAWTRPVGARDEPLGCPATQPQRCATYRRLPGGVDGM